MRFNKKSFYKLLVIIFSVQSVYNLILFPITMSSNFAEQIIELMPIERTLFFYFTILTGLFALVALISLLKGFIWTSYLLLWGYLLIPITSFILAGSLALAPFSPFVYLIIWLYYSRQSTFFRDNNTSVESENELDDHLLVNKEKITHSESSKKSYTTVHILGFLSLIFGGYMLLNLVSTLALLSKTSLELLGAVALSAFFYLTSTGLGLYLINWEQKFSLLYKQLLITGIIGIVMGLMVLTISSSEEFDIINQATGNLLSSKYGIMTILFNSFILALAWPLKRFKQS